MRREAAILSLSYIEFEYSIGSFHKRIYGLYDTRDLSVSEAMEIVNQYPDVSSPKMVFVTPEQYETVFRSVFAKKDK